MIRHFTPEQKAQFNAWFDNCVLSSNQRNQSTQTQHKTLQIDAYWDYQLWCIDNHQKPMPPELFGFFLRDLFPFSVTVKLKGKRTTNLFHGLLLKDAGDWQTPLNDLKASL